MKAADSPVVVFKLKIKNIHRACCRPTAFHVGTMQTTVFQTATTAVSEVVPVIGLEDTCMEDCVNSVPDSLSDEQFAVCVEKSVSWTELAVECGYVLYQSPTGTQYPRKKDRDEMVCRADKLCISYAHIQYKPGVTQHIKSSLSDVQFSVVIKESIDWHEVATRCGIPLYQPSGLNKTGGKFAMALADITRVLLRKRADRLGISYTHIKRKSKPLKAFSDLKRKRRYGAKTLGRILDESGRVNACEICNCDEMTFENGQWNWRGWPLTLQIDHINGLDGDDPDRVGNIRRLCANCHAITSNYRGRGTLKFMQSSNAVVADIDPESTAVSIGPDIDTAVSKITSGDTTSAVVSISPDIDAVVAKIACDVTSAAVVKIPYHPKSYHQNVWGGWKLKPVAELKSKRRAAYILRRILDDSGRLYMCEWCRCENMTLNDGEWEWQGKILRLEIDHIHGLDGTDHQDRIDNLRYLCPVRVCVYIYILVYVCVCVCISRARERDIYSNGIKRFRIYMYIHIYIRFCIYTHIYTHIHTHTHTQSCHSQTSNYAGAGQKKNERRA